MLFVCYVASKVHLYMFVWRWIRNRKENCVVYKNYCIQTILFIQDFNKNLEYWNSFYPSHVVKTNKQVNRKLNTCARRPADVLCINDTEKHVYLKFFQYLHGNEHEKPDWGCYGHLGVKSVCRCVRFMHHCSSAPYVRVGKCHRAHKGFSRDHNFTLNTNVKKCLLGFGPRGSFGVTPLPPRTPHTHTDTHSCALMYISLSAALILIYSPSIN